MPHAHLNGGTVVYDDTPAASGDGAPVLLINGIGGGRRVWELHQTPALVRAGHRVVAPDNRGIIPDAHAPEDVTLEGMAADAAALIEHLDLGPCRVVGFSMGVNVVAELLLKRPELVHQAVLMAGRATPRRFSDAILRAARDLHDGGAAVPGSHHAVFSALTYLSPHTLRDERVVRDWLEVFEYAPPLSGPGIRAQYAVLDRLRPLDDYRSITTPLLCLGFSDDVVVPAEATEEIARTVPGARYRTVERCGHYGFLERPAEVNAALLDFFAEGRGDTGAAGTAGTPGAAAAGVPGTAGTPGAAAAGTATDSTGASGAAAAAGSATGGAPGSGAAARTAGGERG
ncbi:alpha/beta hydrolase [Streptomyces sp. LP05-1]|uniref:Alpha/beta hydrolase n=1 Tax=Streptomyces pyxinae TaxID=2970734 RepID=A0ABT2CDU5_9ACTN|nr:alpha/beta hydrolase [Streptomyces sp. LP05-1]MCS0634804.1 alpha/beta hydrolase [Streptomyces sp. LP05-1]